MVTRLQTNADRLSAFELSDTLGRTVGTLFVSLALLAACAPILGRSLWCDEVMLYSNYPPASLSGLFLRLPYYDQVVGPLYSILAAMLSWLEPRLARAASVLLIVSACVLLLARSRFGVARLSMVFLGLTLSAAPLYMFSELKHYGFEVVGTLLAIVWFVERDPRRALDASAAALLVFATIFGISTLIVSVLCACLFIAIRFRKVGRLEGVEIAAFVGTIAFAATYYLYVRWLTEFQIENYYYAYANAGVVENIKSLLHSVAAVLKVSGAVAVGATGILLLLNRSDERAQRLLLLSAAVGVTVVIASAVGLYPVSQGRHVAWAIAFFVAVVVYGLHVSFLEGGRTTKVARVVVAALVLISANSIFHLWRDDYEVTANNDAVAYLEAQPPSKVGLWMWGQPVIQYYSRRSAELQKHQYFGGVNPFSGSAGLKKDFSGADLEEVERRRDERGAWGRLHIGLVTGDFKQPARSFVAAAPRDEDFHIFASNVDATVPSGWPKAALQDLEAALVESECRFAIEVERKAAYVYKARCPSAESH